MKLRPVALALAFVVGLVAPIRAQDPFLAPDVLGPGPGVTNPIVLFEASPGYTEQARRARLQGIVEVEVVILPDGLIGDVRIHKSLDKVLGLDEAAIRAARAWRFRPAMRDGRPVKFKAIIQLEFRTGGGPAQTGDDNFTRGAISADTPGLITPKVRTRLMPKYTQEAVRAKIQGVVEVDVVVSSTGSVERARVVKSLDTQFGLDEEALIAARSWTFEPGILNGQPVAVLTRITMEFMLH